MAGGIRKIKWDGRDAGAVIANMSVPNKLITLHPGKFAYFTVGEWNAGTTEAEKKKNRTWMWQNGQATTIIRQKTLPSSQVYGVKVSRKLSGPYTYFLDASITGKSSPTQDTGIKFRGFCAPRVMASKWCLSNDGEDVRKSYQFSFGNVVHLNLDTEGLNGGKVTIEVYNQQWGDDRIVDTYPNIPVIDGEVNLQIKNTSTWKAKLRFTDAVEEFYVKVKVNGKYIQDDRNDTAHARYLRIKNKIVAQHPEPPVNNTPLKTGQPAQKPDRYEPCKYEAVVITEKEIKDGKEVPGETTVFESGKKMAKVEHPPEIITKTIFFDFDSFAINADGHKKLSNVLGFLLEHEHSVITLEGYACVIGKQNYNMGLSQKRSDAVKKFFADGKLEASRIISKGKGEINATDDKKAGDNVKRKDEKSYKEARRVDITFTFYGHDAQTIVYETIAPSYNKDITITVKGHDTKACFREKNKHKKLIEVSSAELSKPLQKADTLVIPVQAAISIANPVPLQYLWPRYNIIKGASGKKLDAANIYNVNVHSCRYFSNDKHTTIAIKAYPDIQWTLEFKWNHKEAFAYSYGSKLHPHDIESGKKKVIGSAIDRGWSEKHGEMSQSFELAFSGEWNRNLQKFGKLPQKAEFSGEFGERIAKTLKLFNKIKQMTDRIASSPVTKGKATFEIKAPVIAFAAQWNLDRGKDKSLDLAMIVEIGVSSKPLVEAEFKINLFKIFVETAGNAVCPGAGKVITWVMDKLESNAGIHFMLIFSGAINVDGKVTANTTYWRETTGEVKATGKIMIKVEFKAWAKAGSANIGVDGVIKADASTSVTAGIKAGADKDGIFASPIGEFGGVKATFVAATTVKFGFFNRTFSFEDEAVIVKPDKIDFKKYYLDLSM